MNKSQLEQEIEQLEKEYQRIRNLLSSGNVKTVSNAAKYAKQMDDIDDEIHRLRSKLKRT